MLQAFSIFYRVSLVALLAFMVSLIWHWQGAVSIIVFSIITLVLIARLEACREISPSEADFTRALVLVASTVVTEVSIDRIGILGDTASLAWTCLLFGIAGYVGLLLHRVSRAESKG